MNPNKFLRICAYLCLSVLICGSIANAAPLPQDWRFVQTATVTETGLIKFSIPPSTLDAARMNLVDLRILDPDGKEVPYFIQAPESQSYEVIRAKSFRVNLQSNSTSINVEIGSAEEIDGISIDTASTSFIKPVRIEGSTGKGDWKLLTDGQPIYRQPDGSTKLQVLFAPGQWNLLRMTIDDSRSQPITISGIQLHLVQESPAEEDVPVQITERIENPGETRLMLDLRAANLYLSTVNIETPEAVFTRAVTLAQQQFNEGEIRERQIASAEVRRLNADQPASFFVNTTIPARRILMFIHNQDSPPLAIASIHARRRLVFAVFISKRPGKYSLFTGNPDCRAPQYDLSALETTLTNARRIFPDFSEVAANTSYHPTEALPEVQNAGTTLDVSAWKYRKVVHVTAEGVLQIEPDLETLGNAQDSLRDLRLIQNGKQIPYVLERTSISRFIEPAVTQSVDPAKPSITTWKLQLPQRSLPLSGISCKPETAMFRRNLVAYELVPDARGNEIRSVLGSTEWMQTPEQKQARLALPINSPRTDAIYVEMDNGENPPVRLASIQVFYPVTYALTKLPAIQETFLYYGNVNATAPNYDLSLIAPQLLAAERIRATLGKQQVLKEPSLAEKYAGTRASNALYWGALTLVVIILVFIISRLIPKGEKNAGG